MRKHIVAGNWKMNKTFDEAEELVENLMMQLETTELNGTQLIVHSDSGRAA